MNDIINFFSREDVLKADAMTAFYTFLLTVATFLLCWIGWVQLRGLRKVSKADFINKFNKDFFNDKTQKIILLLDYDALEFKIKEINYGDDATLRQLPYFKVKKEIAEQILIQDGNCNNRFPDFYTSHDIDDLLLGYFEEIGCFEKDNLIGIQGVYDGFDWYIQLVWNNQAIKKYIDFSRKSEDNGADIYENFEYVSKKDRSFGEAKLHKKWMFLWRVKWFFSDIILKR